MAPRREPQRQPLLTAGSSRVNQLGDPGSPLAGVTHGNGEGGATGATAFATGLNMLNELEGAGLLGLPYAIKLCGWVSSRRLCGLLPRAPRPARHLNDDCFAPSRALTSLNLSANRSQPFYSINTRG